MKITVSCNHLIESNEINHSYYKKEAPNKFGSNLCDFQNNFSQRQDQSTISKL